jgi:uncharacterized protein (DUF433 family)
MTDDEQETERARLAFTSEQAIVLAGITKRKLDYWIASGLVAADIAKGEGRGRVRLFSFGNLVELRVVAWLRGSVSLQLIRKIVLRLHEEGYDRPLGDVAFGVVRAERTDDRIVLKRADGGWETFADGQMVLEGVLPIGEFIRALDEGISDARTRKDKRGKVERRRGALGSRPLVAGTRVPTSAVWNLHVAGRSPDEIARSYPGLTVEDVHAALKAERKDRRSA